MLHVDLDKILTEDDAITKIKDIFSQVEQSKEVYVLTNNGRPAVAVVSIEQLESSMGTISPGPAMSEPVPAAPAPEMTPPPVMPTPPAMPDVISTTPPTPPMEGPAMPPAQPNTPSNPTSATPPTAPLPNPSAPTGSPDLPDMPTDPSNSSPLA